jgi:hypothetical protein
MNSKSAGDFRAYLSTYPSGTFVTVATARLSALGGEQPAAGDQSSPRPGGADALRQGLEAFKSGDYAEAMKARRTAAQAGSPPAARPPARAARSANRKGPSLRSSDGQRRAFPAVSHCGSRKPSRIVGRNDPNKDPSIVRLPTLMSAVTGMPGVR